MSVRLFEIRCRFVFSGKNDEPTPDFADLEGLLRHLAKQGRTLVSYNGERFDVPLICAILKGIDPYAPAQQILSPPTG